MDQTLDEISFKYLEQITNITIEFQETNNKILVEKINNYTLEFYKLVFHDKDKKEEIVAILKAAFKTILSEDNLKYLLNKSNFIAEKIFEVMTRRRFLMIGMSFAGVLAVQYAFPSTVLGNYVKNEINSLLKNYENKISIKNHLISSNYCKTALKDQKYIIYHQTAGFDTGAWDTLSKNFPGGAHYLIYRNGEVEILIPENKHANHAGPSFWRGVEGMSQYSIGIECVDDRTGDLNQKQYECLKNLIQMLQKKYDIPNENVLPHAAVRTARYKGKIIRGGKPCGLGFNRAKLGLPKIPLEFVNSHPTRIESNPVINELLKVANKDIYSQKETLAKVEEMTYITSGITAWRIAGEDYDKPQTIYYNPNGVRFNGDITILSGNEILERNDKGINEWENIQINTKVFTNSNKEMLSEKLELEVLPLPALLKMKADGIIPEELGPYCVSPKVGYLINSNTLLTGKDYPIVRKQIKKGTLIITNIVPEIYTFDHKKRITPSSIINNMKELNKNNKVLYIFPNGELHFNQEIADTGKIPAGTKFIIRNVA